MAPPRLATVADPGTVWRIGFKPDPWAWSGWEWATNGRFPGRWDDAAGNFRTIYAGSTLLSCLLEVLASFRVDSVLNAEIENIDQDLDDEAYSTLGSGLVPPEWLDKRIATTAKLSGTYCEVTSSASIAALHPYFIGLALSLKLVDFDAAALKDARPRDLTQTVATYLHTTTDIDGVSFFSRHGDDLRLWAVFERPGGSTSSPRIENVIEQILLGDAPEITEAFTMLGLRWSSQRP